LHARRRREHHHPILAFVIYLDLAMRVSIAHGLDRRLDLDDGRRIVGAPAVMRARGDTAKHRRDEHGEEAKKKLAHRTVLSHLAPGIRPDPSICSTAQNQAGGACL
jgi:hypothetical protein